MKPVTVEAMASILWPVPLPYGGVLVVGGDTLAYYNRDIQHCIDPPVVKVTLTHPLTHSSTHSLIHSLTHPPTHSLTHPLTHSPTHISGLHCILCWTS